MTTDAPPERNKVFISYSRKDREWVDRVRTHLRPLERDPSLRVDIWDDSEIEAGSYWMDEIKSAITSTRAVVLLVSAAFLASDFIESNELPPLLEAAREKGVRILPVHIKASLFTDTPTLSVFQSVNNPAAPLNGLSEADQEAALVKLAATVKRAFTQPAPARRETTTPDTTPAETKSEAQRAEAPLPAQPTAQAIKELPRVEAAVEELKQTLRDKLGEDDSLYAPAALVAESVLLDGLRAVARRTHPKTLARTLCASLDTAQAHVRTVSRPRETTEQKAHLIKYAAGDRVISHLVETALLGDNEGSPVRVEAGRHTDECETVKGARLTSGFISPDFVPADEPREVVIEDVYLFITGEALTEEEDIDGVIRALFYENLESTTPTRSLLIIASEIEGGALRAVLKQKNLHTNITAMRCPGFGDRRAALLLDIALMTSGSLLGKDGSHRFVYGAREILFGSAWPPFVQDDPLNFKTVAPAVLGRADRAIVNEYETYLIGGKNDDAVTQYRVEEIKKQIDETNSDYDREKLDERLRNFEGGVTFIRVGGKTDEERQRRTGRVRRVIKHYEAAYFPGVVAGEHLALANAAAAIRARAETEEQKRADVIMSDAFEAPLRRMAEDFGRDGEETLRAVRARQKESGNHNVGYYGEDDSFVDLFEVGAIVPAENVLAVMQGAVEAVMQKLAALRFTDEVVREVAALEGL